jgi:tetratricopeptide (TPR) repeat protein
MALIVSPSPIASAQQPSSPPSSQTAPIHGVVLDAGHKPVAGASVRLEHKGHPTVVVNSTTDASGAFSFPDEPAGSYLLNAEKSGLLSNEAEVVVAQTETAAVELVLQTSSPPSSQAMEFADAPNFTVAGVTDWTAVGGHGSDATLRTSEALARDAITLKPNDPAIGAGSSPANPADASKVRAADLHRTSGDRDELSGDPLAAVHEYEQAVRLDPSEQNYFAWGSELLLHRAVWQAQQVFKTGAEAYPKSARMLAALGAALFAGALYDQAALKLCAASDLNPTDLGPYLFLGKIQLAAPDPLPCVEPKLARFAQEQPENALANYFYAMAIWKRQVQPPDPHDLQQVESLLTRAVNVDSKCSDAYLQLGILNYSRHDFEKAIGLYKQAITANPQSGEAHYRLGVAYDRTGDPTRAKQEFQLHDEIENQQAAAIESQRREVKQFLVVLQAQPGNPQAH